MTDPVQKSQRQMRGQQMAVVRQAFLDQVDASCRGRRLRALTEGDRAELEVLLSCWLHDVVLGRRMKECSLRLFLASGRLLNQAEVGSPNPERPPDLERSVWSIDTTDNADLPIYGYAATIGDVRDRYGGDMTRRSLSDTYGPGRLIYKPQLRPRSTITVGDSLFLLRQLRAAPSAVIAPSYLSFPPDADLEERPDADHCDANDFIECQTLGGVYVEDIDRILFDHEPEPETQEALDGLIPWAVAAAPRPEGETNDAPHESRRVDE
jgi:hypothetical protein